MATRSQSRHTTKYAEVDSETFAKGETSEVSENISSDTLSAGDRISEIISAGSEADMNDDVVAGKRRPYLAGFGAGWASPPFRSS